MIRSGNSRHSYGLLIKPWYAAWPGPPCDQAPQSIRFCALVDEPNDEAEMFSGNTVAWRAAGDGQTLGNRAEFRGAVAGMADYVSLAAAPLGGAPSVPHVSARGHWTVWIAVVRMQRT